jgi:hypothetical protein
MMEDKVFGSLFDTLLTKYREEADAVIGVVCGTSRIPITIRAGRVVSVVHPRLSSDAILESLVKAGVVSEKKVRKARIVADKKQVGIEEVLIAKGWLPPTVWSTAREKECVEVLFDLITRQGCQVVSVGPYLKGTREICAIAIPYLLKEAQRRMRLAPVLKSRIKSSEMIFRKSASPGTEKWEDINLNVKQKQVYFYVDGQRTVADIALVTGQSEFDVMEALFGLLEANLIRQMQTSQGLSRESIGMRFKRGRFAFVWLLAFVVAIVGLGVVFREISGDTVGMDRFESLRLQVAHQRIQKALEMFKLVKGRKPQRLEELVEEGLLTANDLEKTGPRTTFDTLGSEDATKGK